MYTLQLHLKHPLANLKKNQKKKIVFPCYCLPTLNEAR